MDYQVIGLSGKAGSGKDFIYSNYLKPRNFLQISLAWHFKADLIGKGVITFEEAFVTKPPHTRTLLQMVGTELGRNVYGEKVWCNTLIAWMDIYNHHWGITRFAIPDVRFVNELEFVQNDLDGRVIRIIAPGRSGNSILDITQRAHSSEAVMDTIPNEQFDGLLFNDVGERDTDLQMRELFQDYGWKYE